MLKKLIPTFIISLLGLNAMAQDSSLNTFKEGTYRVENDYLEYSSYKLIRKGKFQKEIIVDSKGKKVLYETIKWLKDGSYIMRYDASKMKLTRNQKFINSNGGIKYKKIKIAEKCYYYEAVIKTGMFDIKMDGKICLD